MYRKKLLAMTGLAVCGIAASSGFIGVQAATISQLSAGTNNTVNDAQSGLVWLKLNQSLNKSINNIKLNPNAGYRLATNAEVVRLFNGLVGSNGLQFVSLFGDTTGTEVARGLYLDSTGNGAIAARVNNNNNNNSISPSNSQETLIFKNQNYGVFQVQQVAAVPEPLTILGSITALGFGGALKRKLAKKSAI